MAPKLVCTDGPLEGSSFELDGSALTIGRHPSNGVCILQPEVSRFHCALRPTSDGYRVEEVRSRNGTFVNGLQVQERLLRHRDVLTVGRSSFRFLLEDEGSRDFERALIRLGEHPSASTLQVAVDSSLEIGSGRLASPTPSDANLARSLNALLEISSSINRLLTTEAIEQELLRSVLRLVPAERAGILLIDKYSKEITSVLAYRGGGDARPLEISRAVLDRVMQERVSVLCRRLVRQAEASGGSEQEDEPLPPSMMCLPLLLGDVPTGILYLDSGHPRKGFSDHDLQMAAAVAGIASTALRNAQRVEWLEGEKRRLQRDALEHDLVGRSPAMREVFATIGQVARTDSTVLIYGQSGTGKELAARAIHRNGPRAEGPFVAINCASLSPELLESELFGHERGAFTGAVGRKVGKLEVADSGTVFLDEIGELPASIQPKLLRVLEQRQFERVGGTRPIQVDIRLIAATNLDLEKALREGKFREDLYYRLNVVSVTMPPLSDRREDIPLLARHFVGRLSRTLGRPRLVISPEIEKLLAGYDWPGNVRELANCIERAVVLGHGDVVRVEDLPREILETTAAFDEKTTRYHAEINQLKRRMIVDAVRLADGNVSQAARSLGLHPNYLHRLISKLDLRSQIER